MVNMSTLKIISKLFSLLIAVTDIYMAYLWSGYEERLFGDTPGLFGDWDYTIAIVGTPILIAIPLICIWFGDSLSAFDQDRQRWCPSSFVKFMGWVLLLMMTVVIIYLYCTMG